MFDEILSQPECTQLIGKWLKHNDFQLLSFTINPLSDEKMGYLGEHLRVKCDVKVGQNNETIQFFVKKKLENVEDSPMALICTQSNAFEREAIFLQFLFREQPNVTWAPMLYCYKNQNCLIFEDLAQREFEMAKTEFGIFDYSHCKIVLGILAKFHAFSYHYQYKKMLTRDDYSMLDEFSQLFGEVLFHKNNEFGRQWMEAGDHCMEFLINYTTHQQKIPKSEIIQKFRKFSDNFCEDIEAKRNKYNVISHGDLWANNIMFKYNSDKVIDCCLVDFQILRFLPPAQDVLMFLHLNTISEFRKKHLQDLLEYYYEQLSNQINLYGLTASVVLPKHEFFKSCKDRMKSVLNVTVTYKTFLMMERTEMNRIMGNKELNFCAIFKDRVRFIKPLLENDTNFREKLLLELQEFIDVLVDN